MAGKIKNDTRVNQTRRNLLKYAVPGLLVGIAAPTLLRLPAANAAGMALRNKKVLVVYYSLTGNTHTVANYVHAMAGGDIVEIRTVNPYPEEYRATTRQAKEELESGYKPPLKTRVGNMAAYDVVFVGSPCWWGTIATPVITFLSEYDFSGKTIMPFMTHEGSGLGRTVSHITSLCPDATIMEGLAVRGKRADFSKDDVFAWLHAAGMAS